MSTGMFVSLVIVLISVVISEILFMKWRIGQEKEDVATGNEARLWKWFAIDYGGHALILATLFFFVTDRTVLAWLAIAFGLLSISGFARVRQNIKLIRMWKSLDESLSPSTRD